MSPHTPTGRRVATAAITATALMTPLVAAVPAQAAPCHLTNPRTGTCNVTSHKPGKGGGGGGNGGGGASGPILPPPPEGLTANEAQGFVSVPGGAAPLGAAPASTADLVATARAATAFPVPIVHTAPADKTYVGLRTSLWVEGFGNVQTEPIEGDGQLVQLVATPKSVTWDLGEKKITCEDGGSKNGKTCTYRYARSSASQPGGSYKITATITWDVSWTCRGAGCDAQEGDLDPNTVSSAPTPFIVGEIQTNTGQ
ncbi:hypothetical protein GCM10022254_03460 [Actinomadura meridiana]|uniref:Secreted protein n=1 Tax=Actinomadura meridiana TaxID=559626 RepID=A0ABP8BST7_9ACTN